MPLNNSKCADHSVHCAGANAVWGRVDKQSLENCMNTIALALSLVMAGTGDLQTFSLLRGNLLFSMLSNSLKPLPKKAPRSYSSFAAQISLSHESIEEHLLCLEVCI